MRTLVLLSFALVPAVASAEPAPTAYVGAGVMVGVTLDHDSLLAARVDGGYHLGETPLWLHASVGDGIAPLFSGFDSDRSNGTYLELRGGLEYRPCFVDGAVCALAGIDVGYHRETIEVNMTTFEHTDPIVVGRVGLDVGGSHLRFRPELEVGGGTDGTEGGLVLGVAYRW